MATVEQYQHLLIFFINLLGVGLSVMIVFSDTSRRTKQIFLGLALSMFGWVNFAHFARISEYPYHVMTHLRVAWFVTPLFFLFIFLFVDNLSNKTNKYIRAITIAIGVWSAIFAGLSQIILEGYRFNDDDSLKIVYGSGMIPFLSAIAFLLFVTVYESLKLYKESSTKERSKVTPFFIGLAIFYVANLIFNISLPILADRTRWYYLGDYSTVILLSFLTYSIIRYRFLDIGFLIGKAIYYLISGFFSISLFALLYIIVQQGFNNQASLFLLITSPLIGVIFIILYFTFDSIIKKQVDYRFITPGYNPEVALRDLSSKLSNTLDPNEIFKLYSENILRNLRPSEVIISINTQKYGTLNFNVIDKSVVDKIFEIYNPEIQSKIVNVHNIKDENIQNMLLDAGYRVILYLVQENFKGIVLIGAKEGDTSFKFKDLDYIEETRKTLLFAINRSLLYYEVQRFNETLQDEVDKATADLKSALTQIQEARRRERDMIDIMGHELRTPISIVKNALSFMDLQIRQKGELTKEQLDKYVSMGLESARREADLIETMLSATKADAKGFDLNFEKVDLNDVINDSFTAHKDPGIHKGLEVTFNPDQNYYVYCDRTRVQEISDNFISNAVKYTQKGFVKVYIEKRDGLIWTTVEDSGMGISQDEIKSLGKKFFRAHQHLANENGEEGIVRPGGTGLGLYVSFALAKLMDGQYTVESTLGQGSKFSFGMPEYNGQEPKSVQRKLQDYTKDSDAPS